MQDVIMKWKGNKPEEAVHGVTDVEIPQFTIVEYRTISTVENLATGNFQMPFFSNSFPTYSVLNEHGNTMI